MEYDRQLYLVVVDLIRQIFFPFVLYDRQMTDLFEYHERLISGISLKYFRFLYENINWNERMIAIKGPRGSGKTTLILQRIKEAHTPVKLYI